MAFRNRSDREQLVKYVTPFVDVSCSSYYFGYSPTTCGVQVVAEISRLFAGKVGTHINYKFKGEDWKQIEFDNLIKKILEFQNWHRNTW